MEAHQDDRVTMESKSKTNMITKGKRTKRQRPSSPLALTTASTSSTTNSEAASDGGVIENPNGVFHMSTSSIEFTKVVREDDHDSEEEMVNCLVLLAQGQSHKSSNLSVSGAALPPARKGLYVYECKTCSRGFSSFQALGGHRASHKKPLKPSSEEKKTNMASLVKQDDDTINPTTLSLQISPKRELGNLCSLIKAPKIYECSICGAEFTSGQALGGHKRRHRPMPVAANICSPSGDCQEAKKSRTLLSLDLNLPAPDEDDHEETKFPFGPKDQIIVFSSSIVDCHF